jgi:hypothetical protein
MFVTRPSTPVFASFRSSSSVVPLPHRLFLFFFLFRTCPAIIVVAALPPGHLTFLNHLHPHLYSNGSTHLFPVRHCSTEQENENKVKVISFKKTLSLSLLRDTFVSEAGLPSS